MNTHPKPNPTPPPTEPMFRIADIVRVASGCRRTIGRERSAGRLPLPDKRIGRMPLWHPATIRAWMQGGGK